MLKRLVTILFALLTCGGLAAQEPTDAPADEAQRLEQMQADMQRDDYIAVSIVTASPGQPVYSAAGHAALRMTCPQHGIDYCYEFDNIVSPQLMADFLLGRMQGLFVRRQTADFIDRYRQEGRGITGLPLNLTADEDIRLWQVLDYCADSVGLQPFDMMSHQCVSTMVGAVKEAIANARISYHGTPKALHGTYRGTFPLMFKRAPWAAFVWNLLMGTGFDTEPPHELLLFPTVLIDEWQRATIVGTDGAERPLAAGAPYVLLTAAIIDKPAAVTPTLLFAILLAVAIVVTLWEWRRGPLPAGRLLDGVLLSGVTLVGLLLAYLIVFSHHAATSWNWLFPVFSPLPALVWLLRRRCPAACRRFWAVATLVLLAYCLLTPVIPQMQHGGMLLLLLTLAVRTSTIYHNIIKSHLKPSTT